MPWVGGVSLDKMSAWIALLPGFMRDAQEHVPRRVAEEFLRRLKNNWFGQSLSLAPLTDAYLKVKQREGLDDRILLATHELAKKLEVARIEAGRYFAGIRGGTVHKKTTLDLVELMRVLEYGSDARSIPARPAFHLTLLAAEADLRRLFVVEFKRLARDQLGHLP